MTSYATFVTASAVCLLALMIMQVATFVVGRRIGRFNIVDVTWGAGFAVVAVIVVAWRAVGLGTAAGAATAPGLDWHVLAIAAAAITWGLRLSIHVGRKTAGQGEDPRYVDMLERSGGVDASGAPKTAVVLRKVFFLQGAIQWVVSLPLQALVVSEAPSGAVAALALGGLVVWALGFVFEAVGDAQLAAFKNDPNRGPIMDRGLWAWTRHPNYFGDACVWWGIWLAAAAAGPAAWTFAAPMLMTFLLVWGSGARLLEKTMSKRTGWDDYARRTSFFVPWPPRTAPPRTASSK